MLGAHTLGDTRLLSC